MPAKRPPPVHPLTKGDPGSSVHLVGLFGGKTNNRWRLYLSPRLDCYAEFDESDVQDHMPVQAGVGTDATRVVLNRGAQVTFTWSETVAAEDQFNLDARVQAGHSGPEMVAMFANSCITTTCNSNRTMQTP
jgi:hypothetical protein